MKLFVKILSFAVLSAVVFCIAVLFFLSTSYGERFILGKAVPRLGKSLGLEIDVASFETDVFSYIHIHGLHVVYATGGEKTTVLSVGDARIGYRLWRLFRTEPYIDSVTADSLSVTAVRDSTGFLLPVGKGKKQPAAETSAPLDIGFGIGSVTVEHSSMKYSDRTVPLDIRSGDVTLRIVEAGDGGYSILLNAGLWEVMYRDSPIEMKRLTAEGVMKPSSLVIDRFETEIAGLQCTMKGSLDLGRAPAGITGEAEIRGDILPVVNLFGASIPRRLEPRYGNVTLHTTVDGTLDNPVLQVTTELPELELTDITVRDIAFTGSYHDRSFSLDSMNMSLLDGTVSGRGSVLVDSLFSHSFSLELVSIRLERLWEAVYSDSSPYIGRIDGSLATGGPLKHIRNIGATARVSVKNVSYQAQRLSDFTADVSYDEGVFKFGMDQESTEIVADVKLDEEDIDGTFTFRTTKPGGLAGFAKIFELYGSLDVEGSVTGKVDNPSITADISGRAIRFHGFPLDMIDGRIVYENGVTVLTESSFSGRLASVDSLSRPFRIPGLDGGLSYSGSLKGPVSDPEGTVRFNLIRPSYKNIGFDSGEADVTLSHGTVTVESARLKRDSLAVALSGDFSIKSKNGTYSLVFARPATSPEAPAVKTNPDNLTDGMSIDQGFLGRLNGTYALSDSGSVSVNACGRSLAFRDIAVVYPDTLDFDGRVDFDFHFSGTPERPVGGLWLHIDAPKLQQVTMDSLNAAIRFDPNRLDMDLVEIYINGQRSWASGDIELKASQNGFPVISRESLINCDAEGRNVTVQLLTLIMPPEMKFTGLSNYRLRIEGQTGNPSLNGELHFADAELIARPDTPGISDMNLDVTLMDSVLVVDRFQGNVGEIPFLVHGRTETNDWKTFDTDFTAQLSGKDTITGNGTISADSMNYMINLSGLDLTVIRMFVPALNNLTGKADASVAVRGPIAMPLLDGSLRLSDVSFQSPHVNMPFRNGFAVLSFDNNTARLDSLSANVNGGRLTAYGSLAHEGGELSRLDIGMNLTEMKLERPKEYTFLIDNAALTCVKQENSYVVNGGVNLGECRFVRDFQPKALLPFMEKVERPGQTPSELSARIRLNVRIRGGDKLWIDNNITRMRLNADIGVIGTAARPNITGRVSVEEGYVLYLDRKFKIERGSMDFIDPNRLNPIVDFTAETNVKTYQTLSKTPYDVTLAVTGPLDQAVFSLTSTPVLDQPDIIALLTIGATREQLTGKSQEGGDTSVSEILKERAEMLSSQRISSYFSRKVGNILGLEEISVEGNLFDIGRASGPQLVASEQISDKVGITYTTAVGHLNEQSIRLDYRLNRFFSLEGQTDQRGRSGLDLKYRLRFK